MSLEKCSCCEGVGVQTPVKVHNRPGLSVVAYRVGQHHDFKSSMLARLSKALPELNTRDNDDFTVALLDAWATVADVFTFYQQQIANESYLRTATERRSLLELARLIGYELRPGVSANVYLAFTLEDDAGEITIPVGAQAQHIPSEGELPQKFETSVETLARPEWNEIKPRQTDRHPFLDSEGNILSDFYFAGVATGLQMGDRLLITIDDKNSALRAVSKMENQAELNRTKVSVIDPTINNVNFLLVATEFMFSSSATSNVTQAYFGKVLDSSYLYAASLYQGFFLTNVFYNLAATQPLPPGILTFRSTASIFGHNAPNWRTLPANLRFGEFVRVEIDGKIKSQFRPGPFTDSSKWVDNLRLTNTLPNSTTSITNERYLHLDTTYNVVAGSTVVIQEASNWLHGGVIEATEISLSEFTLSAKVTRLRVRFKEGSDLSQFSIRGTSVYLQSEELKLARLPIVTPVQGTQIHLEGWIDGLIAEQSMIVCGELADDLGNYACEHAVIDAVEQDISHEGGTIISLRSKLTNNYIRSTASINANVALATHGESKAAVLGSGDGAVPFQQFSLPGTPLTHLSSNIHPSGAESALEVRVNNIRWHQVDNLRDSLKADRHYMLRHADDGSTTLHFGDGEKGARIPTGLENVQALFRFGTGRPGNVAAKKISLLARRPLGVRGVVNPLAATGGDNSESRDDARVNASLDILTLDRIVSLQDYEDYARTFAGISKALATWTWFGHERGVFLTVAGVDGANIQDPTHKNLLSKIRNASDPTIPVRIGKNPSYQKSYFQTFGTISTHPDYDSNAVLLEVEQRLRIYFSFEQRSFGQDVTLSEIITVSQAVPGVIAVDIDSLGRFDEDPEKITRLRADVPRAGSRTQIKPAQLLLLYPGPLGLGAK